MDWKTIIVELQDAGLSQTQIGERIGKSQAWVSAIATGTHDGLRWDDGTSLINLHNEFCKTGAMKYRAGA